MRPSRSLLDIGRCYAPFRCLAARPHRGTRAGILPGCPSLDTGSREAEVEVESRTFQSVNLRSNHLIHLAPTFEQPGSIPALILPSDSKAATHRKDATAERVYFLLSVIKPKISPIGAFAGIG
ncbi:hypothetical protein T265_08902 [Opisthorchis viverrini]|uniref:Uncharacterized protein n=1 Tax=Opisthorchis viverrini TaxID=6198 RepID=A0A074ZC78_OPIVI|nr:hypothetical protein T265_08902 [Opisthorchis viverrini]KER23172.1 hypothetical protein T265_08902 [Opisthorchis viverrini]